MAQLEEVKGKFVLIMDKDETRALRDILARIGGDTETTRRKFTNRICNALSKSRKFVYNGATDLDGTIWFRRGQGK